MFCMIWVGGNGELVLIGDIGMFVDFLTKVAVSTVGLISGSGIVRDIFGTDAEQPITSPRMII